MGYRESAYKQLLMGVSQQAPQDRLEGQLSEQLNMTSDLVFGLRRRSPLKFLNVTDTAWTYDGAAVYNTRLMGSLQFVIVENSTGTVRVYSSSGVLQQTFTSSYLVASSKASIRFATIQDQIFIANTEQVPTEGLDSSVASYPNPDYLGYWYGVSTAFSKTFDVTITDRTTGTAYTYSYTTPDGSDSTEVAQATLEYVATQLRTQITSALGTWLTVSQTGGYLSMVSSGNPISVTTSSGSTYAKASKAHQISLVSDLPAYLSSTLDNFIMTIGSGTTATYYRWSSSEQGWLEDAAYGLGTVPSNMPVVLQPTSTINVWELVTPSYTRRAAGNSTTNPSPAFLFTGITGLGAFQGRLVILSQETVCMSDTTDPLRYYRTTTESLVASDYIEAAGSDAEGSTYTHAVVFNKDLVCIGPNVQAVVPGSTAVTPSNVVVAVTSKYQFTLYAKPAVTGRSVYASASRGDGYCGMWEIVPSDYVDSQIVARDVTDHIPTYTSGYIYCITASATSSVLVAAATGSTDTLLVQEYNYNGNEKRQAAWHKWVFPGDIVHAEFEGDILYLILNKSGTGYFGSIDLRSGSGTTSPQIPRIDAYYSSTVSTENTITIPLSVWNIIRGDPLAFKTSGEGAHLSQSVKYVSTSGSTVSLRAVGAEVGSTFSVGLRYTSAFTLTPPVVRDGNDTAVRMHRSVVQRYRVQWQNTGSFVYAFSDKYRTQPNVEVSPMSFGDPDLSIGSPMVSSGRTVLPCRLDMGTVVARYSTSDVYDLNPQLVEYGYRFNQSKGSRA